MSAPCPCHSGHEAANCCTPIHRGEVPESPQRLMRARYSAYTMALADFLLATWHPSTRPEHLAFEKDLTWRNLDITATRIDGDTGSVRFIATWQQQGRWGQLQEQSRFLRENGQWFYVDGDVDHVSLTPSRNAPCPCGSGHKYKRCCCS